MQGTHTESQKLHIRILVIKSALESVHSLFGRDRLRTDLIAYFEIECNVLCSRWKEL
jgi:hypothetical protein